APDRNPPRPPPANPSGRVGGRRSRWLEVDARQGVGAAEARFLLRARVRLASVPAWAQELADGRQQLEGLRVAAARPGPAAARRPAESCGRRACSRPGAGCPFPWA